MTDPTEYGSLKFIVKRIKRLFIIIIARSAANNYAEWIEKATARRDN